MGFFRKPRTDPEELAKIREQVRYMREHWDATAQRREEDAQRLDGIDDLRARLDALDERITSVSTELANQVNELGHEIENLSSATTAGTPPDEAHLDAMRTGQERLANEQARYQIAFREDLARLAEQLRKAAPPR